MSDNDWQGSKADEWDRAFMGFFRTYLDDADTFVLKAWEDEIAREMLVEVYKFCSIADKTREVKFLSTERAQMFMLVCMCEAIFRMSHPRIKKGNFNLFLTFFEKYLGEDEKTFKYGFQRSLVDDRVRQKGVHFTTEELAELFYDLRSQFTHQGVGYDLHFAHDDEYSMLCFINFHGKRLKCSIGMTYEKIKAVFVRMAIRCIDEYLMEKS